MTNFMAAIFIEPHERAEAIEAYRDRLSDEQVSEIEDAPDGALIRLSVARGITVVTVIHEVTTDGP